MSAIVLRMASSTAAASADEAVVRASRRGQEASSEAHERGTGRNRRERGCVPPPVSCRQHHTFDRIGLGKSDLAPPIDVLV